MTTQTVEVLPTRAVERMYALDDLHIRQDGSGRIVEAYAAVFDDPTEIMDIDGHYHEVLSATSFDRTLKHKGLGFGVLFNHARTVDGDPYPAASMPIGVPIEIHPDGKGLFTATRYLDNPLADYTLDAIKQGAIRAQSFSGRFTKSQKVPPSKRGDLATIRRNEVDMREYGPAVFAAYTGAAILGTRAEMFMRQLLATPPDRRLEWLSQFEFATPLDPAGTNLGTQSSDGDGPAGQTEDPPAHEREHSARSLTAASRAKAWRITNKESESCRSEG